MIRQNKNQLLITKITFNKNYYIITFNNAEKLKLTLDEYYLYDLVENDEISLDLFNKIKKEVNFNQILEKTIKYCSVRLRSEKEVKNYLYSKHFLKKDEISEIVKNLANKGIIDDRRYAKYVIDAAKLDLKGSNYIMYKLSSSMVDRKIIAEELENFDETSLIPSLIVEVMKYLPLLEKYPKSIQKKKIFDKLYRKGFKENTIYKILNEIDLNYDDEGESI